MKEFVVYTLARVGLFVASFVVILGAFVLVLDTYAVLWSVLLAAVVSAVASYYLLQGPRARFAEKVDQRAARMSERFEAARAKEDDD